MGLGAWLGRHSGVGQAWRAFRGTGKHALVEQREGRGLCCVDGREPYAVGLWIAGFYGNASTLPLL